MLGDLEGLVHGVWEGVAVGHVNVRRNEWIPSLGAHLAILASHDRRAPSSGKAGRFPRFTTRRQYHVVGVSYLCVHVVDPRDFYFCVQIIILGAGC